TMNLSNDMAIGSRLASLNNPFANLAYAKKLSKAYFASGSSDVRLDYGLNDLTQSRWANVFGGVNIIDSESGGVYGVSLGVDKKIKDNAILGFYASFAKATLKDKSLEQKSSNFQVGTYSSIGFSDNLELGLKAYLGVAPTEQESFYSLAGISNSSSEYSRLSAGINANLGKNFAMSEDTLFIKPFVGASYYLTHTPEYTEQGGLAKNVKSANNNSISVELGAEFRKYFNEFAYFYTTPKIEQFVYNQSDDFSASFIGSNTGFNIQSDDKLKTYAQLILGASMNFTDNFAATASFAGKQIVAGKVDKKNETYMSGNLELRYRF
ncbi:autotransporter outer membrane beta-barrel domain-containing protein, partial [Campylobacter sp. MIT 12-5580]|uniref:autotransporter outer membrane beta-barrel domain-containing protein n=1 Tax=Campylobacter sp. MIT 12-5580 TaxID=2040651 RepID=UPI0010F739F4